MSVCLSVFTASQQDYLPPAASNKVSIPSNVLPLCFMATPHWKPATPCNILSTETINSYALHNPNGASKLFPHGPQTNRPSLASSTFCGSVWTGSVQTYAYLKTACILQPSLWQAWNLGLSTPSHSQDTLGSFHSFPSILHLVTSSQRAKLLFLPQTQRAQTSHGRASPQEGLKKMSVHLKQTQGKPTDQM